MNGCWIADPKILSPHDWIDLLVHTCMHLVVSHRGLEYCAGHMCCLENVPVQLGKKVGGKNKEEEKCKHFPLFLPLLCFWTLITK